MDRRRDTDRPLYILVHPWMTRDGGGCARRMRMLLDVLGRRADVLEIRSFVRLVHLFVGCIARGARARVLIYTSLMAPLVAALRLMAPAVPVFYMVRGDEITYVRQRGRRLRARLALGFQRLLVRLGCRFVFVCDDLRILFQARLGPIAGSFVLPNTLGKRLPPVRPFDGTVALVGHFNSVKNIEGALRNLSGGRFCVHLFGNYDHPREWHRPWLQAHGFVEDLPARLRQSCSLVVLSCASAGFPNVVLDALEAGCAVLAHREFPFQYLPLHEAWRFALSGPTQPGGVPEPDGNDSPSDLERVLGNLLHEPRDFKKDNAELVQMVESDWETRVWDILG